MDIDEVTQALEEQQRILETLKSQVQAGEWWLDSQIRIVLGNIADLEANRERSNGCLDQ